jgi:ribonuclease HII
LKKRSEQIPNASGPSCSRRVSGLLQDGFWEDPPDMLRLETMLHERGVQRVAGLDEAGRGPLAGPVFAAAVILPPGVLYEGLTDSKLLTPDERDRWFEQIREAAVAFAVAWVGPGEIDEINILQASKKAMEMAVNRLSVRPGFLLVDGITPLSTDIPQQCVKKGDRRSQSIAAASILAKVSRDRLMDELHEKYPPYNFKKNKGYGTLEHRQALRRFGRCPCHRLSFSGVPEQGASGERREVQTLFK